MSRLCFILTIFCAGLLAACGDDDGFECDLDEASPLAQTDWPSARFDSFNTANVEGLLTTETPEVRCIFPRQAGEEECASDGSSISTTVIVGEKYLTVATQDGRVRQIDHEGEIRELEFDITLPAPATTPLIAQDGSIFVNDLSGVTRRFDVEFEGGEQQFTSSLLDQILVDIVMGPDGVVYPATEGGLMTATCTNGAFRFSRNLGSVSIAPAVVENPAPVDPDPDEPEILVLTASDSGRVTAFEDEDGDLIWTFFTGTRVDGSSLVVDEGRRLFIIPDNQGEIFAGDIATGETRRSRMVCSVSGGTCNDDDDCTGDDDTCLLEFGSELIPYRAARCLNDSAVCKTNADCDSQSGLCVADRMPCQSNEDCGEGDTCIPNACIAERIRAAGALGAEHYYLATEGVQSDSGIPVSPGTLYAFSLAFNGGGPDWTWTLPEGGVVQSSPMVVTQQDDGSEIIVFGADFDCLTGICSRSVVFAVRAPERPEGGFPEGQIPQGQMLWEVEVEGPIGRAGTSLRNLCNNGTPCRRTEDGKIAEDETIEGSIVYIGTGAGKLYEIR